ncbi:solute carrier family 45 member 4 isoform X2 [Parasteatoda tepidariorum]
MQKTSTYFRTIVAFHNFRDRARETAESWQERGLSDRLQDGWNNTSRTVATKTKSFFNHPEDARCEYIPEKYNYIFRPKSRWELILLSGTVCGIEFCYAAETAFVTPILLSLGLSIKFVTMIWCLSPLIGLFLTPILGSMSDSCESKFGRRRPFIIMYSIGILLGLILVPNGQHIGLALGDKGFENILSSEHTAVILNGTSLSGDNVKLNQVGDLNKGFLKNVYSDDIDEVSKNGMTSQNGINLNIKKRTLSGENVPLAIPRKKDDYQNSDAIINEDEAEMMDEFSKLVDASDVSYEKQNGIESLSNKNKYSRGIDDADVYPSLHFGKMNMRNLDPESEKDDKYTKTEKLSVLTDDFSKLVNNKKIYSDELSFEANPSIRQRKSALRYTYSREIDGGDVYPSFLHGHNNKPTLNELQYGNRATPEKSDFTLSPKSKRSSENEIDKNQNELEQPTASDRNGPFFPDETDKTSSHIQTWSVVFTVIGTVLLDFCSDACQSPSRTYLLDVTIPSDHAAGLSTFTVMAGFGGAIGYTMGALNWEATYIGQLLGGQVNAVFMIVTVIFIICLVTTVTSFPEIPLCALKDPKMYKEYKEKFQLNFSPVSGDELERINTKPKRYGSTDEDLKTDRAQEVKSDGDEVQNNELTIENKSTEHNVKSKEKDLFENIPDGVDNREIAVSKSIEIDVVDELGRANERPTLKEYLKSIIHMPNSLRVLCLTNLFCWMSLVCYSLYFTDFVGESVFGGDPKAPEDSESFLSYKNGVQFGCWGMALYSISCSIYSLFIESLVKKVGAKPVYIGGQLVYSFGMVIMALTRHKVAVILLSPTAGIMYSTLFTMPYLLIAHYHCNNQFSDGKKGSDSNTRGIGTDVAAVSSMVFLSQFILSLSMGSIVEALGSTVVPVCAAAILSACGAVAATQVTYLDI